MFIFATFVQCYKVEKCPTGVLKITSDVPDSYYEECDTEFTIEFDGKSSSTNIGSFSFSRCEGLTGILTIPATTEVIGSHAFYNCISLKGLKFTEGTKDLSINSNAFSYCTSLSGDLVLPNRIKVLGSSAFYECFNLNGKLILPNSIDIIPKYCFFLCKHLSGELIIPDSVVTIRHMGFYGCGFTSVFFGEKLESFEMCALSKNPNLEEIKISSKNENFTFIDGLLFSRDEKTLLLCPGSKSGKLVIPSTIETIGDGAYAECNKLTGNIVIPNGIKTIKKGAFYLCKGLSGSITIPESVTMIESESFICPNMNEFIIDEKNANYKSVNGLLLNKEGTKLIECPYGKKGDIIIPEGVTTADDAFKDYCNFTSLTIPASLTTYSNSFGNNFERFIVNNNNKVYEAKDDALYNKDTKKIIYPCGKKGKVILANSNDFWNHRMLAEGYEEYKEFDHDEFIKRLEWSQFWNADEFAISESLSADGIECSVENGMILSADGTELIWCPGAKTGEIVIPESVTKIKAFAFVNCYKLTGSLNIPSRITEIGEGAFINCVGLTGSLTFGSKQSARESLAINDLSIRSDAFYGTGFTGEVKLPANVVSIGTNVFDKCKNIDIITVDSNNANYKSVDGVLYDKKETKIISYPENKKGGFSVSKDILSIDISSFSGKKNLDSISVDESNPKYKTSEGLLYDKSMKTLLRCPEGKSGEITLPSSVETIGIEAFSGCSKLTRIVIPEHVALIESQAFSGCHSEIKYLGKTVLEFECGLSPDTVVYVTEEYPGSTFCNVKIQTFKQEDNDKEGLSGGAIAGIVISCLVAVAAISFCVYWFVFRNKPTEEADPEVANNSPPEEVNENDKENEYYIKGE